MLELGYISQEEHDQAAAEHLSLNPKGPQMALEPTYSFFVDQIIEDLIDYLRSGKRPALQQRKRQVPDIPRRTDYLRDD